MSEAAMEAVEAGTSKRRSARLKRNRTEDTEQPSAKFDSGVVQNTNSNGVAADSRGERKVPARSGRVKLSSKEAAGRTEGKAATPAVARTPRANSRRAAAAAKTKEPETVSASRMEGKAAGATKKSNATSVRAKSNTPKQSQSQKEVPQSSKPTSRVNRRATFVVKPQSINSQSRKRRKDTAHGNDCLEESFSDEIHSESCSTCSDGSDAISCSCSDCEFEDVVRGKKRPAPKKTTLKVVRKYSIHTPD